MKKLLYRIPNSVWLGFFMALALAQVYFLRNVVMGDAFIHFVFARGISEGQPFFYNGQFSAGSTSPLWSLLLAPVWKICGLKIIWAVKILAALFVGLAVFLTFKLAEKISKTRIVSLTAAALLATSFVLPYWAAKGMETPLFVCLVIGSFLVYFKILESKKSLLFEILLGAILGISILARPEAWFLSAILGIGLLAQKKYRAVISVGLPASLIFAPYYGWLLENTGSILPSSVARILRARQWAHEFGGIYFTLEIPKILLTKFLLLIPFFLLFFWQKEKGARVVWWPIYAWLIFYAVFFSVIFPTTEGYRYILPALPFFYLVALTGILRLPKKWHILFLALVFTGSLAISSQQFLERRLSITNCEVPFIDMTRRDVGLWIDANTLDNSVIAMKEIDQSAFYGERRMLSLDGTLDTRAIEFISSGDQLQFLKNKEPDYFILEEEMYREYPDWQNSNLLPLADSNLQIGALKNLDGVDFQLLQKFKSGDPESCPHLSNEYYWWVFKVKY
ncbi:MAG: glycosyltransferase family 39 protein [Candidatus Peribacteraceae bacterium]|nr:glycosyltransferase family 39 protein [Candidatus Peribacteraceae bacterium]